eukprot:gene41464-54964_t
MCPSGLRLLLVRASSEVIAGTAAFDLSALTDLSGPVHSAMYPKLPEEPMPSALMPTDVVLVRARCLNLEVAPLARDLAKAPICLELGAGFCRSAWSEPSGIAYLYLSLPHRTALSLNTLARQFDALGSSAQLKVSRLALMADIPGASRGNKANIHYAVEMTPEESWELELQRCLLQPHVVAVSKRYALLDAQWERIKDLLPGQVGQPGATAKDNRLFVDAVLYRYRAGIPWRDLPARFGDFRVVHTRHSRWSRTGVWQRLFEALAQD